MKKKKKSRSEAAQRFTKLISLFSHLIHDLMDSVYYTIHWLHAILNCEKILTEYFGWFGFQAPAHFPHATIFITIMTIECALLPFMQLHVLWQYQFTTQLDTQLFLVYIIDKSTLLKFHTFSYVSKVMLSTFLFSHSLTFDQSSMFKSESMRTEMIRICPAVHEYSFRVLSRHIDLTNQIAVAAIARSIHTHSLISYENFC